MRTTIATLSTWTGIHRDTIRRRLAPLLTGERAEQVDSVQALPLIFGGGERLDPQQERAMLDRERRMIAELDRKQRERNVIPLAEADRILGTAATNFRESLMGAASRWSDVLAAESDPFAVTVILENEIRTALNHLADAQNKLLEP